VYTVVNRVGVPAPEHVKSDDDLFAYLLKVSICLSVCLSRNNNEHIRRTDCISVFWSPIKSLPVTLMVASQRALFVVRRL